MIDDHRRGAALGLAALAGIVDDEGIEMRQRPQHGFRPAFRRQRQRLARQPFEIAVLAHMDDGMGLEVLAQPGIEGEIAMGRDEIGIVIARGRDRCCSRAPAGRRRRHCRSDGSAASKRAVDEEGIALRPRPSALRLARAHATAGRDRKCSIVREREVSRRPGDGARCWSGRPAAAPSARRCPAAARRADSPPPPCAFITSSDPAGVSRPTPLPMRPSRLG